MGLRLRNPLHAALLLLEWTLGTLAALLLVLAGVLGDLTPVVLAVPVWVAAAAAGLLADTVRPREQEH
jgi:hypothetical protein